MVLKNGEISEQGTYAQLVENKGEFNEFLLQYLAQEEDDDLEEDLDGGFVYCIHRSGIECILCSKQ